MAQKLAIVILALALIVAVTGVYLYVTNGTLPFFPKKAEVVVSEPVKVAETPTTTSTKPMPTEAEINAKVEAVMNDIQQQGRTRRLTTNELEYLSNPRTAAIKDLTK